MGAKSFSPVRNRSQKRRLKIYMAIVSTLALIAMLFNSQTIPSSYQDKNPSLDAFVSVAMCGFDATDLAKALRDIGEWTGPIYIVTDTPEKVNIDIATPIDVRNKHPDFLNQEEYDLYRQGINEYNPALWSKWFKTQIFQLLPDDIQTIALIDADIIAQQPLSKSWLNSLAPNIADESCELILSKERWYTNVPLLGKKDNHGKYWSGLLIQKRNESKQVLNEWSQRMVRPPFMSRDQGKLTEAIEAKDTKLCWLPHHWFHVQNQADLLDKVWFKIVGKATFRHLASSKKGSWREMLDKKCDLSNVPLEAPVLKKGQ